MGSAGREHDKFLKPSYSNSSSKIIKGRDLAPAMENAFHITYLFGGRPWSISHWIRS
jgi:hypothetical protein